MRLKSLVGSQFDLIYFDPPYYANLYEPVLNAIAHYQLLVPHRGEIAIEYDPKKSNLGKLNDSIWELIQSKSYGKTALNFYRFIAGD